MRKREVWIETYGCQMNKAESEALLISLAEEGWKFAQSEESADLVILNTCSVRETAEQRILGRLGHYRSGKRSRRFMLAVVGCMAERMRERISADFPEVDIVVGNFKKGELARAVRDGGLKDGRIVLTGGDRYAFSPIHSSEGPKAFVPIMHGCNNFCSYCVVPLVRGREVSRDPADILAEIKKLEARGVKEITLLGQNVNSYRYQGGGETVTFPRLMQMAAKSAQAVGWIRFLTSHPRDLSDEILDVMGKEPRFCRHIHLPLQSGSERVLRAMNRGYTPIQYLDLVDRIRAVLRGVSLTTDILIGFPGETGEEFADTIRLIERIGFDDAFMYYYNPREGTPAFAMADPIPLEVKLARLARLIETQKGISRARMNERRGSEICVLVEGVSKKDEGELLARTEWDAMAVFRGTPDLIGGFSKVRLETVRGNTYRARAI